MQNVFWGMGGIVVCCSLMAWLACQVRQPIILAYFLCGVLIGPFGFKLITEVGLLENISRIGITLLLFLAGLVLHPDRLRKFFKTATVVTLAGSLFGWILALLVLLACGYELRDSIISSIALMFSSTILVIKLLPTTALHQKRMGSICIAVLIAQDLLAVIALMFIGVKGSDSDTLRVFLMLPVKIVFLIVVAIIGEQFVIRKMMWKADRYNEVLMILCIGWCVGVALLSELLGISYEVGAFVAGVAMARGKIAPVLSEQLKPLRDFFLMFFFFVLGTAFEFEKINTVWLPACLVSAIIIVMRPLWLRWLFRSMGEEPEFALETAVRLSQSSEFALIIAVAAVHSGNLTSKAAQMVQLTTIATMVLSSYIVVFKYPTPIGFRSGLQKD